MQTDRAGNKLVQLLPEPFHFGDPLENQPFRINDHGEGDMPIEKFVPIGPSCSIGHYEIHPRTVNRVFVDTIEWIPGCGECGRKHDGPCIHTPTTWGWRKN